MDEIFEVLKLGEQANCKHSFIKDAVTGTFKCVKCYWETDGKNLKEWRE